MDAEHVWMRDVWQDEVARATGEPSPVAHRGEEQPDRTPAATLLAAADRLDNVLAALDSDVAGPEYRWTCDRHIEGDEVARYCEAVHPGVGRALSALLRECGELARDGIGVLPDHVLAVARAVLGETGDDHAG